MSIAENNLPDGLLTWLCTAVDAEIVRLERHVARREAWIIDLKKADGTLIEGFLRLQRETGGDPHRLERETRILKAIAAKGIPAPQIYAWSDEFRATLMERDSGRADIDNVDDRVQQRAVMEDFIRVVARFHQFDAQELGLDDVMLYYPGSPRDCALREVDELVSQWQFFLNEYCDPLLSYGLRWLERFAPEEVARISLLQGDTGPVNFMFQGDKVSSMIDWECGHYGDPLEDLGNIMVREFWNPSGGLTGLFKLYEQESGVPYDRFRAQYYAVQQNVRGMIPIHYVANNGNDQESLRWYLCYRYLGDRATAEMLAMAMNIKVDLPTLPDESSDTDILAQSAIAMQNQDVSAAINDKFALSRAKDVSALIECMERKRLYGAHITEQELLDLKRIVGSQAHSVKQARKALVQGINDGSLSDEVLIPYLVRKARREEWLYTPAVNLYPERTWSAID